MSSRTTVLFGAAALLLAGCHPAAPEGSVVLTQTPVGVPPPPAAARRVSPSPAPSAAGSSFRMTVEDIFSIKGRGTVATGRIERGDDVEYSDHAKALLQKGRELQEEENVPWIVLCHEPPEETPLCPSYFAPEAAMAKRMIEAAQPDFSLHGHIHEAPTAHGGSWIWQVGKTVCFNPGQSLQGDPLHYIFLKWRAPGDWTAVWNGASRVLRAECRGGAL